MKTCKLAALAAGISLALGSGAALAAAPTPPPANALPGQGKVIGGGAAPSLSFGGTAAAPVLGIDLQGNTVISWGGGGSLNATGLAGFNLGSAATVNFTGAYGVLNVDASGNPSQIFGRLTSVGNLYVANANGIIVGASATVSSGGALALIANPLGGVAAFNGTLDAVGINGIGGDVTIVTPAAGAGLSGTSVLISGGGSVNVDLGALKAGAVSLAAGVPTNGGAFASSNPNATLAVSGALGGASVAAFASAGDASNTGTLALGSATAVAGTLTNVGALTLADGFAIDGALVNRSTLTQTGAVTLGGSVTNAGIWDGGGAALAAGGLVNDAKMTNLGELSIGAGGVANQGVLASAGQLAIDGGDLVNQGELSAGSVYVTNGSIANAGTLSVSDSDPFSEDLGVQTRSDASRATFKDGADYSLSNTGTLAYTGAGDGLYLAANFFQTDAAGNANSPNGSTGSFSNTGILQPGAEGTSPSLWIDAANDLILAGQLQFTNGAASTTDDGLGLVFAYGSGLSDFTTWHAGVTTIATPIIMSGGANDPGYPDVQVGGNQIIIGADITVAGGNGVGLFAGDKPAGFTGSNPATDYAIRIANGATVTGSIINLEGTPFAGGIDPFPNLILQGAIHGDRVYFQGSDLFSGPAGKITLGGLATDTGNPQFEASFTGALKTAPYLNDPNNFRYNYLPLIDANADGKPLLLVLNPIAYETNGTFNVQAGGSTSAVNILVQGSVNLTEHGPGSLNLGFGAGNKSVFTTPIINAGGSAVTGVVNLPNTHLVLQATGDIQTGGLKLVPGPTPDITPTHYFAPGDFYWPGLVYFGTISTAADGTPLPGTLGLGTLTTTGNFSNVLPGDVAGASGLHFMTQLPLTLGGSVTTSANAWVNFGAEPLTLAYASGALGAGQFFGGTQGPGGTVDYGPLAPVNFVTRVPTPAH